MAEIMSEHIVERAIIMAAGIGQRLRPVTLTTPKPLVTVNGVCMIDTIIAALHENEIHEIYVVVGYLKEQFYEWAKKYNGITLIENPWYAECNNIASLYVAREYLNNAIILDGDQIIRNPAILHREFTRSGYSCAWTDRATNEWLLTVKWDRDKMQPHRRRSRLAALQRISMDGGRWAATQKALGTGICAKRKSEHLLG